MLGALLMMAAATAAAEGGELKTFGDWVVGCDNGLLCQASAMMPQSDTSVVLTVRRAPEGAPTPEVWLRAFDADPVDVTADGKRLGLHLRKNDDEAFAVAPGDAVRLLDAVRASKEVEALDAMGKPIAPILADGATAALLFIDEKQHRLGTKGALVRRGDKPDSAVPAPPALPVRYSVKGSAKPPAKLSAAFIAKVRKDNDCADETDPNLISPDRLDDSHTLVVITLLCQSGAYNFISENFIITDGGGTPRAANIEHEKDHEEGDLDDYNMFWNAKDRRLETGFKGRGIGDCGFRQQYAWDGAKFRLVGVSGMSDCRGVVDYISAWRARVVER